MAEPAPMVVYDVESSQPDDNPIYLRQPPWKLILHDAHLIIKQSRLLLVVFTPFPKIGTDITWLGLFKQILLTVVSLVITAVSIASWVVGFPPPILTNLATFLVIQLSNKLQGIGVLQSYGGKPSGAEQWLFVNGIATSQSGTQLIINRLEELFHRPITGIHNRTQGVWFDLIECLIQRDLLWPTDDVRDGYRVLSSAIRNPGLKRIVLISHSQGGIILSAWLDQLLDDFPHSQLAKLEIYTFASAANHFSAPGSAVFKRIEHFVNERDFVARIGVIEFAPPYDKVYTDGPVMLRDGRYVGRIFKRKGATGHLMLSHYLAPGNSFLDHPAVRKHSQLTTYLEGGNRV